MKKSLILSIIALICVSLNLSAAQKTKECIIFEIEGTVLKGTEAKDELGSTYIHLDFVPFKTKRLLYIEGRSIWEAVIRNSNGKYSLNGYGVSKQSFRVINPQEGSTKGYMTISLSIGGKGVGIPSTTCIFSGETINEYDETTKKYKFKEGRGTFTGNSYPSGQALNYTSPALIPTEKMAPAWGTFKVYRKLMTENEIINYMK